MMDKALVPVAGKPCIRWIVEELVQQGFTRLNVCINEERLADFDFALNGLPVVLHTNPASTSICERILKVRLQVARGFLVVYGDDLTHTNYAGLVDGLSRADAVLATTSTVPLEFGLIAAENGVVKDFIEKPNLKDLTGSSIWTGRVAMRASSLQELVGRSDLAREVFPAMLKAGKRIIALNGNEPWYDVGSIAHWRRANEEYAKTVTA